MAAHPWSGCRRRSITERLSPCQGRTRFLPYPDLSATQAAARGPLSSAFNLPSVTVLLTVCQCLSGSLAVDAEAIRDLVPDPLIAVSRAENLDRSVFAPPGVLATVRHADAVLCRSTPFFGHNTLLPDGDVLLCCMDCGRAHVLGNLLRQSWQEVHAGP